MSAVVTLTPPAVLPEEMGIRLDKWLAEHLPDLSRTRLKQLIENGSVVSPGLTIADAALKVKAGQIFVITLPPDQPAEPLPQAIALDVLYEDRDVIVIDKPAGMVVHPAAGSWDGTLVNALLAHCGETLSGIGGVRRPGIVHRLDKDTSGVMIAAKNDKAHHGLSEQFAARTIERAYQAVVWGVPSPLKGEIEGNIGRSSSNRKKMALVAQGGKHALTRYTVLRPLAGGLASLVECRLATGRTHQIRVHLTSLGHPLVGDQTYGRGRSTRLPVLATFPRQALHAYLLGFTHPETGERLCFQRDIPLDIRALLKSLDSL